MNLFETLGNLHESESPLEDVLRVLNKSYSNIDNRKTMYKQSLDDNFSNKENFGLLNVLSDEKALKPLSSRSPEERQEFAKEIEKLDLGPNSELIKAYYGIKNEPTTYKKLAELRNRSETNIISKIKGGLLSYQIEKGLLNEEKTNYINEFKEEILKGYVPDKDLDNVAIKIFNRFPRTTKDISEIKNRILEISKRFAQEGLTKEEYTKAAIKNPSLFFMLPDTIEENIRNLVSRFEEDGLTVKNYLKATLKRPQLFTQSPDTIEDKIRSLVSKFKNDGLNTKDYLKAAIKQPSLFTLSPDTIEANIRGLVSKFEKDGLNTKDYLKAATKQPSLFTQSPDTIEANILDFVSKFEADGLTTKDYLKAAMKQPTLFYLSPDKIEENLYVLVSKFEKDGLTTKDYLKAAIKSPCLLCMRPDTIECNIRDLVTRFENEGLTVENYLKAALKQPTLFYRSPDAIETNIRSLVSKFEKNGLTIKEYLKTAIKQPPLFYLSPNTIESHIKAIKFRCQCENYTKDKTSIIDEELLSRTLKSQLTYNKDHIYLLLMNTLIFKSLNKVKLREGKVLRELPLFLKANSDKTFDIKIVQDECSDNFIKFATEYSQNILGKNIFNIEIVDA